VGRFLRNRRNRTKDEMSLEYKILERQYMNLHKKYAAALDFIDEVNMNSIDYVIVQKAKKVLTELKDID
jgi:hypothetical protein